MNPLLAIGTLAVIAAYLYRGAGGVSGSAAVDAPDPVASDPVAAVIGTVGGILSVSATTYSDACVNLVKRVEGCNLQAYPDARGWSIGWGHFGASQGQTETQAQADADLDSDLASAANTVNNALRVYVSQGQFDAMTSFCYNVGGTKFASSTLLKLVNAGDFAGAANEFHRWVYSNGSVLDALARRRTLEAALFLTPDPSVNSNAPADAQTSPDAVYGLPVDAGTVYG